ncbi:uncharacterized protein LOC111241870 [Vigna radiata var. radiata]|uniref:Uncharacterized protein LOC111241870 n=1 Tax=Vigna radiata var. radiata TaxID=3916 RepID=A0A3Q0F1K1_VIGRR|nr:uncharacterized protein LOC111241870 [Vigna radiata var. radiata]
MIEARKKESDVVEETGFEPDLGDSKDQKVAFRKKDNKALFILHQCVYDTYFKKIQYVVTAREAWNILLRCHARGEKIKKVRLQTLRRQYELLQMEECDQVGEYFNKVVALTNQMKRFGEKFSDLMIIEKITRSLPSNFDYIVVAIEESRDLEKMKIEELQSSLEAHEMRLLDRNTIRSGEQALKRHHSKKEKKKTFKKWKGKYGKGKWRNNKSDDDQDETTVEEKNGKSNKTFSKKDKRNVECFNCHISTSTTTTSVILIKGSRIRCRKRRLTWFKRNLIQNHSH